MYSAKVIELFRNPENVGPLKDANGVGKVGDITNGDILKLYLRISESGLIESAKFKALGNPATIACASALTILLKGKFVEDALRVTNEDILEFLGGLPQEKIYTSVLAEDLIRVAIDNYNERLEKLEKNAENDED